MAKQPAKPKGQTTEDIQLRALLADMEKSSLPVSNNLTVVPLPTGITSFDYSTGIGGLPRRRMSIFQGEEGAGKTMLALQTIATTQRNGGRAAFVDNEHALTPDFARLFGVDFDALVISRPRTLNQGYDVGRRFWSSGLFDIVVMDSMVALATQDEIDSPAGDSKSAAGLARLHSEELRKMVSTIDDRTAFVGINQLRENPRPPTWWKGGKMLYSPGGKALRYMSSLTVDVRSGAAIKKKDIRIGQKQITYIVKNKVGIPYRRAEFDLMYESGIDRLQDLITTAIRIGLVEKAGSWLEFDIYVDGEVTRTIKALGRDKFEEAMRADEDAVYNLESQVLTLAGDSAEFTDYDPNAVADEEDL